MTVLTNRAARLAQKHLEAALPRRFRHTVAVAERAQRLAPRLLAPERAQIVMAAAWLHDIGYAPHLAETGFHPIDGANQVARDAVLASCPSLVGLVAHHTGAVFEARERALEVQLEQYPVPDAVELAILSCADLCAGPDGAAVDPADRINEVLARYRSDHPVHRAITQSGPMLVAQSRLILAAADATDAPPQVFPLPDWAERQDPFAPQWDAIWNRDSHRITAASADGMDRERGVEISLTDPLDPLDAAAAQTMADDLRAAAAAVAGKPLCWAQYRAFATHVDLPPSDRGGRDLQGPWVSATFRLGEILEFQWDMASEGRLATVDQRMFTTLGDVTTWTELVGASCS